MDSNSPAPKPKRKRSRKSDGQFEGNTPGTETAWEPVDIAPALPKEKYIQGPKVTGLSNDTSGKYGKKPKVTRPGLGKVKTTFH